MNPILLNAHEAMLQDVPFWPTVRTVQKQSVAEHSFRVALIADRIAQREEFDDTIWRYALLMCALLHDQYAAFTGHLPDTVYNRVDHNEIKAKCKNVDIDSIEPIDKDMKRILTSAILIAKAVFIASEMNLGNQSVRVIFEQLQFRLKEHSELHWQWFMSSPMDLHQKAPSDAPTVPSSIFRA